MNTSMSVLNITRIKEGENFVYYDKHNKRITNKDTLERIKKLHIPPNWKNVLVSDSDTDYLQTTGIDTKGRTQYIYHPVWVSISRIEKYDRMKLFAKKLPVLMKIMDKKIHDSMDLEDKEYIVSLIFRILKITHSRIGNDHFAQENNTFGLTTLQKKHVSIDSNNVRIAFVGKKNVKQTFSFNDKLCSKILQELKKIPGERLFKTKSQDCITSNDINNCIRSIMGEDFSAKDFRTYAANELFLKSIHEKDIPSGTTQMKKIINECYDEVAEELGNTRSICKTSYVMPIISEKYKEDPKKFLSKNRTLEDLFKLY